MNAPLTTPSSSRGAAPLIPHELPFWLFAAVLLALTWTAVILKARDDRELQFRAVVRSNANLARALEEHTVRTLKSADQSVLFLKSQFERDGASVDIPRFAREVMISGLLFNQLGIIDEHGIYRLSNLPGQRPIDLSDREHFTVHRDADTKRLFISKPVLGRASGKWSVQLTRRIDKPDGSFGGVVVVSIDPFYFTSLYSDVDLGRRGVVTLLGDDRVIRARRSGDEVSTGQSLPDALVSTQFAEVQQGHYWEISAVDGVTRIHAFRRLQEYPLTVIVGVDEAEAMAEVHARIRGYVGFAALGSVVIVLFAVAATRMLRRQRAISARLEESQARAEEASRLKSEFLASMSHELRTPLNGIIGYAEYLRDAAPAQSTEREFASIVLRSGQHLNELVTSILDLSKVEAGRMELDCTDVPVRDLVDEAVAAHRLAAQSKGLALGLEIGPATPTAWRCDRTRTLQVLHNLLHNAVKFTDSGSVTLRVNPVPDGLAFTVSDTGCGIDAAFRAELFEKFRQADVFITRRHGGTGLGLALSRELATLMGGSLTVDSVAGLGSTFTLTLPATPPAAHAEGGKR